MQRTGEFIGEPIAALSRLRKTGRYSMDVELLDLCARCIDQDPARRPASAVDVAKELHQWRLQRQKRLEVIPVVRARNRLAWTLLLVFGVAATSVIGLVWAWQRKAETALQMERALGETREAARLQADNFAAEQKQLALEKSMEADDARELSTLVMDIFKSTDPIALEGSGFRNDAESVQTMTGVELLSRVSQITDFHKLKTLETRARALDGFGDA